ncbi:hypothetical protein RhiirA4_466870 [Rhizophagus irregularis]|uniref:Uncharacterized protein n=1 Tax=Rhizophagus irregularis TaxID=588596 RepID=A0A2I1GUS7_9GLOM|nr:hypothetical protein RhiirA4_466870 [Rhizophagus irregularis]
MCNDIKWKLPSGSYVEDNYFNYTKDLPYECPSHSFILDIENGSIMKLFNKEDQEYIKTYNAMADPELEDGLMEYLVTFNETDISKMRDKINAEIHMILKNTLIINMSIKFLLTCNESTFGAIFTTSHHGLLSRLYRFRKNHSSSLLDVEDLIFLIHEVLVAKLRIKQNIELSNKKCNNLKEALRNKQSKRSRSDNDLPDNQTSPRKKSSYIILAFN